MKRTSGRKATEGKEPHLLKVIRGKAPSIFQFVNAEWPEKLELSDEEEDQITQRAMARVIAPKKMKELQEHNERLQADVDQLKKSVGSRGNGGGGKVSPQGFKGLSQKKTDMSQYFDWVKLTDVQRDCLSMKYEYGLPLAEIARRMRRHHSTVQYHIGRGEEKMKQSRDQIRRRTLRNS